MTNQEKAQIYKNLMFEHDILQNKIANIKSSNFELTPQQENEIRQMKIKQGNIMQQVERLMMM